MGIGAGQKVVLAMSGGVDSSAAAWLLLQRGYEVVGCFMRLGSEDEAEAADGYDNMAEGCDPRHNADRAEETSGGGGRGHKQGCCSVNDAADARLVAAKLGIAFYVVNFKRDFGRIIDYFTAEYNAGRTPNPCVRCNDWLKFGKLHQYAASIDADYVATGHYARTDLSDPREPRLLRGVDHAKDQSYVLFGSPREQLRHMLLPVGGYQKPAIRRIARRAGLPVYDKPDSQEICFVPDNDYAKLVERRTPGGFEQGDIVDTAGKRVGAHAGHQRFTIGQRRGVGVALGYPIYVVEKDPASNTVTVGSKQDLLAAGCTAGGTNWLIDPPGDWMPCGVKVRYNSQPVPGAVRATGDDALEARFDQPVSAVTPGQAVVCYGGAGGERVLGGGWIDATTREG